MKNKVFTVIGVLLIIPLHGLPRSDPPDHFFLSAPFRRKEVSRIVKRG